MVCDNAPVVKSHILIGVTVFFIYFFGLTCTEDLLHTGGAARHNEQEDKQQGHAKLCPESDSSLTLLICPLPPAPLAAELTK